MNAQLKAFFIGTAGIAGLITAGLLCGGKRNEHKPESSEANETEDLEPIEPLETLEVEEPTQVIEA